MKALEVSLAKGYKTGQDGVSWMLSVLQGRVPLPTLTLELRSALTGEEVARLYRCVTKCALRFRNRALARLSHKKGIGVKVIQNFLGVGESYVAEVEARIQERGLGDVERDTHKGPMKYEQDNYKSAVFAILHSPPSVHGINRTTWRVKDIHRLMSQQGLSIAVAGIRRIIRSAGFKFYKARKVLTSNDPDYKQKLQDITSILRNLKPDEKFFSVDEYGPFAVKIQGGKSLMRPGELKTVPQYQKSKGSLILTAALELSENQVTHFYSDKKNTDEMLKLLEILLVKYADQACIYFSWDAASWHASKKFCKRVEEINSAKSQATQRTPLVKLAPSPRARSF
jgi:transposase